MKEAPRRKQEVAELLEDGAELSRLRSNSHFSERIEPQQAFFAKRTRLARVFAARDESFIRSLPEHVELAPHQIDRLDSVVGAHVALSSAVFSVRMAPSAIDPLLIVAHVDLSDRLERRDADRFDQIVGVVAIELAAMRSRWLDSVIALMADEAALWSRAEATGRSPLDVARSRNAQIVAIEDSIVNHAREVVRELAEVLERPSAVRLEREMLLAELDPSAAN